MFFALKWFNNGSEPLKRFPKGINEEFDIFFQVFISNPFAETLSRAKVNPGPTSLHTLAWKQHVKGHGAKHLSN